MLLVTTTDSLEEKVGLKRAIKLINDAGFDAVDISFCGMAKDDNAFNQDNYLDYTYEIRDYAKEIGIGFVQAHAPFPVTQYDQDFNEKMFKRVVRSMEISSILGVEDIVVHPPTHIDNLRQNIKEIESITVDFYKRLIPYCKKYNIRIATENMFTWDYHRGHWTASTNGTTELFAKMVNDLDSKWVKACVDVGHAGLTGDEACDMIKGLNKNISCLHVHDNDYRMDTHLMPYCGDIKWDDVISALNDIEYKGNFTFEALRPFMNIPEELLLDALTLLCKIGRYIMSKLK